MSTNSLVFCLFAVMCLWVYIALARRQKFLAKPKCEKLWIAFIMQKKGSPAWVLAKSRLEEHIMGEMASASSSDVLKETFRNRTQWVCWHTFRANEHHSLNSERVENFYNDLLSEFNQKYQVEVADNNRRFEEWEAARLEAAQNASTRDEAREILRGHHHATTSRNLAEQKWDLFSLKEVLAAGTLLELETAGKRAREVSLAKQFVPFMHEYISRREVECASTADDIIMAAEGAPMIALSKDTALFVAFTKLHRLFRNG